MSRDIKQDKALLDRRSLLRAGAAAALAAPIGVFSAQAFPFRAATPSIDFSEFPICKTSSDAPPLTGAPRKLKLSWNAGAVCLAPLPVAIDHGFFQKQNLDVELVNYSGSTDQLLEAIATGKTDAGLGMALRWLKPLEQGFDVKIAAGTHGGCMRVLSRNNSGVDKLTDLKGKIVAVGDLGGPDKNFFSIQLAKQGIDPNKDVDWRAYPGNLLQLAVEKGEVHAFLASDPIAYLWLKDSAYKEVASNLDGEYKDKTCCIVGLRGSLVREEPLVARAITQALLERHHASLARCGDVHIAEPGQGGGLVPALRAQDRQPAGSAGHGPVSHPSSSSRRGRAQAGAEGLCGRPEERLGFQAEHRYSEICGADLCRRIRCLRRWRSRNRSRRGQPLKGGRFRFQSLF